ncbi:MAG: adenylosuccinate synthase [Anaerolineae bacterium]
MPVTAVVGAQWGDEGKGRVVDYLASSGGGRGRPAHMVIRYQGGDNAGHTVVNQYGEFKLHLVPSGIFNPGTQCIVGTGCVVNPETLVAEMDELGAAGVSLENLFVSSRAHLILPYHRQLDGLEETARGARAIGTTKRGIGPSYADKAARWGLRAGDLLHPSRLRERLAAVLPRKNRTIAHFNGEQVDLEALTARCLDWAGRLRPHIADTFPMVRAAVEADQFILLEGQLGVMRDLDWGVYPYVTSSNPLASFGPVGAGLPVQALTDIVGVVKAYVTAVGAGPLPTELTDATGERLREVGREYGATTGRPRRCGWLDAVALDYANWLNGFTSLVVTKLDVLDGMPELKICTAYRLPSGEVLTRMPDPASLESVEPVYEMWPGWDRPTVDARRWEDLPVEAQGYLRRIEELAGAPIRWVSVGPEREAMIAIQPGTNTPIS